MVDSDEDDLEAFWERTNRKLAALFAPDPPAPGSIPPSTHESLRPATVYMITSPSGKKYIGETRRKLNKRLDRHRDLKWSHCKALVRAIKQYGWSEMVVTVLWQGPASQRKAKEAELIAKHGTFQSNHYNCTPGGDANPMDSVSGRMAVKASWQRAEVRERHMAGRARRTEALLAKLPAEQREAKRVQLEKNRQAVAKRTSSKYLPLQA
jgi:group I intron endonuclease